MITSEVIPYLCGRELLSRENIVDGEVRVFDASRRNQNFRVINQGGRSLFVKQGTKIHGSSSTAREAAVYSILEADDHSHVPFPYAPRLIDYNPDDDILILELIDDAVNLREKYHESRYLQVQSAAAVGEALGALHMKTSLPTVLRRLGRSEPGVLEVDRPGLALLSDFSGSSIDLIRMVQSSADLIVHLDEMRQDWRNETLIHHDIRMDNIIQSSLHGTSEILIVDWETASAGDPAWDVGAAVADYLGLWIQSIPVTGTQSPEKLIHLADFPLSEVQESIAALWRAYARRSEMSADMQIEFMPRVARFCGLKLVQSAIEMVQNSAHWNLTAVTHMQVAANMMGRPQEAVQALLCLDVAS
ncbi:phosphotransferase [Pseudarthrobacter sp. H3Y2-7]|uniref:phosphotransferase n=1 Tax=Pseudarthrobacter naphthalenicus TaxID=3031328 RepID=UPI0023B0A115|nr:phosphotransferase [Pseudarthrobacter sp. H3Y2-7]MDE8668422.1 phosphotransferase [Pseudarthrobacter sp. H3Y2-7]